MIREIEYDGISSTPADTVSKDGMLAYAVNAITDVNGGLEPVLSSSVKYAMGGIGKVVAVHDVQGRSNYIVAKADGGVSWFCDGEDIGEVVSSRHLPFVGELRDIAMLGNTLCLLGDVVYYAIWNEDTKEYKWLGSRLPMTSIEFGLRNDWKTLPEGEGKADKDHENEWIHYKQQIDKDDLTLPTNLNEGWSAKVYSTKNGESARDTVVRSWSDKVMGWINKFISEAHEKGKFVEPMLIRYAYRLYDGTLTAHSAPVLAVPNSKAPVVLIDPSTFSTANNTLEFYAKVFGLAAPLVYQIGSVPEALQDWKDIITGIEIYASAPLSVYDQNGMVWGWDYTRYPEKYWDEIYPTGDWANYYSDGVADVWNCTRVNTVTAMNYHVKGINWLGRTSIPRFLVPQYDTRTVEKKIKEAAEFYHIATIPFDKIGKTEDFKVLKLSLENLNSLTASAPMVDEYHSHYSRGAGTLKTYNGRLNLGAVSEEIINPYPIETLHTMDSYSPWYEHEHLYCWRYVAELNIDGRTVLLAHNSSDKIVTANYDMPNYLYYPDTRCQKIYGTRYILASADSEGGLGNNPGGGGADPEEPTDKPMSNVDYDNIGTYVFDMTEHKGLNGAV